MSIPVTVIAGKTSGIPVTIDNELYKLFQAIKYAGQAGNHWARICAKELEALSSGHVRNNVFIQSNGRHEEFGEYTMILPGCKASFRKNNSGKFYIYALEADLRYEQLQKDQEKPGLFHVRKVNSRWASTFVPSGYMNHGNIKVMAVSDRARTVSNAAILAEDALIASKLASEPDIASYGFNLHFTPGKRHIGGLRNIHQAYNADTHKDLHESALLLAGTMEAARITKGVNWVSECGGSGVLAQAMRILKDKGVSFNGLDHRAFLFNPRTNLHTAETLAKDLGIGFHGSTKDWFNVNHRVGSGLFEDIAKPYRQMDRSKKYAKLSCAYETSKALLSHRPAVATLLGAPAVASKFGATAIGIGSSLAAATTPSALMYASAAAVVASYLAAEPIRKGASAVVKSYYPLAAKKKLTGE